MKCASPALFWKAKRTSECYGVETYSAPYSSVKHLHICGGCITSPPYLSLSLLHPGDLYLDVAFIAGQQVIPYKQKAV